MAENDLLILRPDDNVTTTKSAIVARISDPKFVGHWSDKTEQITTFFSGSLSNVPEPFRVGTASAAAQTLTALYAKYSDQAFEFIDGAFACAILDWRRRIIILGRDKLGIGRAYLSYDQETVTFSDSLSDLLEVDSRHFDIDVDSIHTFLMIGWIPAPHSMLRGIEKLPSGTILKSQNGDQTQIVYYDLFNSISHAGSHSPESLGHQVATRLDRSVDRGLAIGQRWGSFLSGGVDSSSVVSSLARTISALPTYFGGFAPWLNRYLPNPEEPAMSQLVADRFKTDHHMLWLGPEELESMPEIVHALEEPVSDGGCIVLAAVMRAAKEKVNGLMTGVGGDFLFTGERRHVVPNLLRYMRLVPDFVWYGIKWLSGVQPFARNARVSQMHFDLTRLLALRKLSTEAMYVRFFLQADTTELQSLFSTEAYTRLARDPLSELTVQFQRASKLDPLSQILYLDLKTNVPDDLVREAETLGRHFGLTIYNPFLDAEFVDFAVSTPKTEMISGLTLKVPLKAAMRGRVPDEVLDRKKGGLGSPIRWWVTQTDGFVANVLSRHNLDRRGLFSAETIEKFRIATEKGTHDYSKLLWSLFTLELWLQQFADRKTI